MKPITEDVAKRILEIVDAGLSFGKGSGRPGDVCIEIAVSAAMGEGWHNDSPSCVAPSVRALKIALNDKSWSSPMARAKGLRRLGIAQLGTNDTLDEKEFARRLMVMAMTKTVPLAIRLAAIAKGNERYRDRLNAAADRCAKEGTVAAVLAAKTAADDVDNAEVAAYAATAAAYAAYAANAANAAAGWDNGREWAEKVSGEWADKVLGFFAEAVVEILIDMKAPGTKFLYLTE